MDRIKARHTWKPALGLAVLLAGAALVWAVDYNDNGIEDDFEAFFSLIATNLTETGMDYDDDDLSNIEESLIWSDPLIQDTDQDGFVDGVDGNPVSRAVFRWGDPRFTSGDYYSCVSPPWIYWSTKEGGEWTSNGWQVAETESAGVGRLYTMLNRASLYNNLMLDVCLEKASNASLYVELLDSFNNVVQTSPLGNIISGTGQVEVVRIAIPLTNETVTYVQLQRGTGPVKVFGSSLYVDEDGDGVDADQEAQIGTSDYSSDTYQDGTNDWTRAFQKTPVAVMLGNLTQAYDGYPHGVSVTASPSEVPVRVTYNGLTNEPIHAGSYAVTARVVAVTYAGATNGVLEIQPGIQTIAFLTASDGRWLTLEATASSGLPVTLSVSGHAAVRLGDQLYFVRSGSVEVQASQAGNDDWLPVRTTNVIEIVSANPPTERVVAWGWNNWGQADVPAHLSNVLAVAGGYGYSLALKSDGSLQAWGLNDHDESNVPTNIGPSVAIASGFYHGLAVRSNGTIAAWGDNMYEQCDVPAGLSNVVAVAAGEYHSLALRADGTVVGWGAFDNDEIPTGLSNVVAIAAGAWHCLALRSDGTVAAWGAESRGQCDVPVGLSNVIAIAGTYWQSVALKADGTCAVWGNDWLTADGLTNLVSVASQNTFVGLRSDGRFIVYPTNGPAVNVPADIANVLAFSGGGGHVLAALTPEPFKWGQVATPVIHSTMSNGADTIEATIRCATTGSIIRFTTDNSEPTAGSAMYTNALTFTNSTIIKAKGFKSYYTDSETGTGWADYDRDQDGLDDEWERKWGLNSTNDLPSGADLAGWWRLDAEAGSIAFDACNIPHDGLIRHGVWSTDTDLSRGCLILDGSNTQVLVENTPRLGDSNLTVAAFVSFSARFGNRVSGAASNGCMTILWRQGSGAQPAFAICKTERNSLVFQIKGAAGNAVSIETGDNIVADSQWLHVAGVVSNGLALFYVNGEKIGQKPIAGAVDYDAAGLFAMGASGQPDDGNFWGRLDEVRLYKIALSAGQIERLCRPLTNADEDGFYLYEECVRGTDPNSPDDSEDSDGDGLPDDWEREFFGSIAAYDGNDDPNNNGFSNYEDWCDGTDPLAPDWKTYDGDGDLDLNHPDGTTPVVYHGTTEPHAQPVANKVWSTTVRPDSSIPASNIVKVVLHTSHVDDAICIDGTHQLFWWEEAKVYEQSTDITEMIADKTNWVFTLDLYDWSRLGNNSIDRLDAYVEYIFGVADLDVDSDYNGYTDDENDDPLEMSSGGLVVLNQDDDNGNSVADKDDAGPDYDEDDLAEIYLQLYPSGLTSGELKLEAVTGGSKIKIWDSPWKETELPLTNTWIIGSDEVPSTLYVEGIEASSSPRDIELRLRYTAGGATFDDHIKLTVLKVEIKRDEAGGAVDYQPLTDATRKVLPGQKMNLKAEVQPAGVTVTDWEWTLPGTTFKNYEANQTTGTLTPMPAGNLDDQTVHFYWADSGDDREVKCKVKIGGQWFDCGKEVLHVKKPTCTLTTTLGTSGLDAAKTKLGLLADADSTKGITYTGEVQVPTGFAAGEWHFVQLVTPARHQTLNSGTNQHIIINGSTVLDTTYPYEPPPYTAHPGTAGSWATGPTSHTEGDSPGLGLDLTVTKRSVDDEAFSTYVMFLPSGTDSRYVPLRYVNWTWKGAATRGTGSWTLDAGSAGQSVSASAETSAHPTWTANVTSGGFTWVND